MAGVEEDPPGPAAVPRLATQLTEGTDAERLAAIEGLASLARESPGHVAWAADAIRAGLDDADPAVRATACRLVGRLGLEDCRDQLKENRLDADVAVSQAATEALSTLEGARPVEPVEPPDGDADRAPTRDESEAEPTTDGTPDDVDAVKQVSPLSSVGASDVESVGQKASGLGDLLSAGFPVPDGFVVPAGTFGEFLRKADLGTELRTILDIDHGDSDALADAAERATALVRETPVPPSLREAWLRAFDDLEAGTVAVRASPATPAHPDAPIAGQFASFMNVDRGPLADRIQDCWASLFSQRAFYSRHERGIDFEAVQLAVVVQRFIDAETSGVVFTSHPSTGEPSAIIEAAAGLGEAVVSGLVSPDHYVVDRADRSLTEATVADQSVRVVGDPAGGTVEEPVPEDRRTARVLDDSAIDALVDIAERAEAHFGRPQDIEWSIVDGEVFVLQARPITTIEGATGDSGEPSTSGDRPASAVDWHLDRLETLEAPASPAQIEALLGAVAARPADFEGRVGRLIDLAGRDSGGRWASTMALAALSCEAPALIAPHAAALVSLLDSAAFLGLDYVRETLIRLVGHHDLPIDELLRILEQGPPIGQWNAALVLGSIAATGDDGLPVARLVERYRGGDEVASGGAAYVLALVAAERPDAVPQLTPTPEGLVSLAESVGQADRDRWIADALMHAALPVLIQELSDGAAVADVALARTPMGTQLVITTPEPGRMVGKGGETLEAIQAELSARFALDDLQIDVQKPETA